MPHWTDPTIVGKAPKNPQKRHHDSWPKSGYFVRNRDGTVLLRADNGDTWPTRMVQVLQGSWGAADNSEGVSKLLRVREHDAEGNVLVSGDKVVIWPMGGDERRVLVVGGVRGVSPSDFLPYSEERGGNPNRFGARMAPIADGESAGFVDLEVCRDDRPSVQLSVTGPAESVADGPPAGARTFASMDVDGNVQIANSNGETLLLNEGQVSIITSQGHVLILGDSGVQVAAGTPPVVEGGPPQSKAYAQLSEDAALIGAQGAIRLLSASVEMGGGALPPIDRYILSSVLFPQLAASLLELVAAVAPVPAPLTAALAGNLTTSVAAGPPFLSLIIKGQ